MLFYFTYISPQIRKVTNIFKNTNVRIAFRCRNTTAKIIRPPKDHDIPPHNKWGIYQLKCNTCGPSYVGQTNRSLNICFQEHIRYIRNNNPQSAYAQHILQNRHEYGQMNNIMILLKPLNNPNLLIPYEQYYIQTLYREGKLIPKQSPGKINPLFQTAINPPSPHIQHEENSCASAYNMGTTQNQPHQSSNTQRAERYVQSQIHITKHISNALITKQPMKHTTHKRTQ